MLQDEPHQPGPANATTPSHRKVLHDEDLGIRPDGHSNFAFASQTTILPTAAPYLSEIDKSRRAGAAAEAQPTAADAVGTPVESQGACSSTLAR